ncbi:LacI family DNA-binding transcriptional regulator [Microbacterium barkeri]|uniref:LacI family DNA-binding transcriptional regulator n=1 Tax=Microbacterium barkeri TaxID=33917 RepID=UPI0024AFE756|nr:LacI family DNA-binding transcriptional regulator [Microbacterium barkeri]MDI6943014.1 LacI family DNA-binding transcriptional regulator [Microbacterium barkeri]
MKRVGIRDVAVLAGVSISSVSNALNRPEAVSDHVRTLVHAAVDQLGYVPLRAAQQLRAGRSGLIGMTVISIGNPFFAEMLEGAEEATSAAGYQVMLGNSDDSAQRESSYLELFEQAHVEGMLISPFGDVGPALERLRAQQIPVALVDGVDEKGLTPSVSLDNVLGGRMAVQHLIELGRRRIAFVGAREEVRQTRDRLRGAAAAAQDAGLSLDVTLSGRTTPRVGAEIGERIAALPAAERPDAVFAANDQLACGIVHALVSAGIRVPGEIAIVGYDDIPFASIAAVPITSVRQPARAMGRRAAEMLVDAVRGAAPAAAPAEVFAPELVVRASTRA